MNYKRNISWITQIVLQIHGHLKNKDYGLAETRIEILMDRLFEMGREIENLNKEKDLNEIRSYF